MKKSWLLMLVAILCMAVLTGCGGPEDPTDKEILKGLQKKGFIDEEIDIDDVVITHKEDEEPAEGYHVYVKEIDMDDDKEQTDVTCILTITEEFVQKQQEVVIDFRVRDDKSWRCKEAEAEEDETVKLIANVPDSVIKEQMGWTGVTVDDRYFSMESDNVTWSVKEHKLDSEKMTDTVSFACNGEYGYKIYDFTISMVLKYNANSEYWSNEGVEVGDYTTTLTEEYQKMPTAEDVLTAMKDKGDYIYNRGYYYLNGEGITVSDFEIGETVPEDKQMYVDMAFLISDGIMTFTVDGSVYYYYDESNEIWQYRYMEDYEITAVSCDAIGTWYYTDGMTSYVLTITDTLYPDSTYLYAEVEVTFEDASTCKYTAYLYEYEGEGGDMTVYAQEWITEPTISYYMENFSGSIENGKFVGNYSWDDWQFEKQN